MTSRPELAGTFGMVAATHWLAAHAGMRMLEAGGNAFDAAAAAGFVLQVVEPHQNGLGGEAPMILYSAADDAVSVICGQGPAPASATIDHYRGLGLELVPGAGLLAACVPAAFGSWMLLLERYGTLTLREILEPAVDLALNGFPALPMLTGLLRAMEPEFARNWPTSHELWLANAGERPRPGQRITNRPLAATYERLLGEAEAGGASRERQLELARRAYYEGFVAEAICDFVATPQWDPHGVHSGLLARGDLAGWRASLEQPTSFAYKDFEIFKTGPWGQGPVALQQLALLEGIDLQALGAGTADFIHVVTEAAKLAFADREAFYGDPDFTDVPLAALLSPAYNAERRELISREASNNDRPGSPAGRTPRLPTPAGGSVRADPSALAGEPSAFAGGLDGQQALRRPADRRDTVHLDVADRFGNFVSATPSGGWLQSSPAIPGLGFCLGTRAQMFWLEDGFASALRPGSRPRTTLSPSLAFRDGRPYMAFGTPGGDQQDQWPLKALLYHSEFGLSMQEAIEAPNWHSEHFHSSFYPRDAHRGELVVEQSVGREVTDELSLRGHRVVTSPPGTHGRVTAVRRTADGLLHGAADPRSQQAYAAGR